MPDRPVEEIRLEVAGERQGLANDLDALRDEVRTVVPVVVGTMIAVALLTREKRLMSGLKLLWKLL